MRLFFFTAIFQLSLLTVTGAGCNPNKMGELQYTQAPDFTLPTLNDPSRSTQLSSISQDYSVMLLFWTTWCPSCREEIPQANKLYEKYQGGKELRIVSVNVEENPDEVRQFIDKYPVNYPILLDKDGGVADRYGLTGLPAVLVLAKGGKIVYYGFSIPDNLDELIKGEPA